MDEQTNTNTPQQVAPVYKAPATLTFRLNNEDQAKVNALLDDLRARGYQITTMRDIFWSMFMELTKLIAGNQSDAPAPDNKDLEEKVKDLERQLEKYSSIDLTTLEVDNKTLREENGTLGRHVTMLQERIKEVKQTSENFDREHIPLPKSDPRLVEFFKGADHRIKNGTKNVNGRATSDHIDVIEDLTILATVAAKKNLISAKEGF